MILCFFDIPSYIKFAIFCLFSYILGIVLIFCKYWLGHNFTETLIRGMIMILFAFLITILLLFLFKIKNMKFLIFILYSLLIIVFFKIVNMFNLETNVTFRFITFLLLLIISTYMIYDTHNILQRDYHNDFVKASLDYFLDIFKLINNWFQRLIFYKEYKN